MKKSGRALALSIGLTVLVLLFSSCNNGPWLFTNRQVKEYLDQKYPGEHIQVQQKGLNSWICWFDDLPDAVFRVKVISKGSGPIPVYHNALDSDASNVIWMYYLDTYQKEVSSLDAWEIGQAQGGDLRLQYTSMQQVHIAAEQLQAFYDWAEDKPHTEYLGKGSYYYSLSGLLPWQNSVSESIQICDQGPKDSIDEVIGQCADALMTYYAFYNLPCDDFTAKEISDFAIKCWAWTSNGYPKIWDGEEELPGVQFAGIGVDGQTISYGGLYEMLTRLGMAVDGTSEYFSFTGADGAKYEFSYNFCQEVTIQDGKTHITWYYLRNGYMVDNTTERLWNSWRDYGPLLRLNKSQNYHTDETNSRRDFMVELITGLDFKYES